MPHSSLLSLVPFLEASATLLGGVAVTTYMRWMGREGGRRAPAVLLVLGRARALTIYIMLNEGEEHSSGIRCKLREAVKCGWRSPMPKW